MTKASIMLIVSALLLVGSSVFGFFNKNKLADTQTEIATAKTATANAQSSLSKAQADQKKAESAKTEAEGAVSNLKTELATATEKTKTLEDASAAATKDLTDAKAKIAELETKSAAMPTAATPPPVDPGLTKQLDDAKRQLAELQVIRDGLQSQVTSARAQTEELTRRVAQRDNNDKLNGLQGRVRAVDHNWNFVVIDLGGRSGVNNGATMVIRRGGSMVGRVRVTSVEPAQSIADIVPNSVPAGVSVQAGDTVVFQGGM